VVEQIFFFVFAILAVGSAIAVVSLRNPIHSVISLMVCFLQMAALFVMLRAPFIAVVQVFVYVGAVLVLFLFVIMMLDIATVGMERFVSGGQLWVIALLGVLVIEMVVIVSRSRLSAVTAPAAVRLTGTVREVGEALFTKYILPFEVVSLILLVALLGAIVLGRKELK